MSAVTEQDRALAQKCVTCPLCTRAQRNQRGVIFWMVKHLEGSVCPAGKA